MYGFTLTELVVIIGILGILAVIAIPKFFQRTTFDTQSFYDQAQATVRFAQKVAVAQRTSVRVNLTGTTVQVCYCATPACAACGAGVINPTDPAGGALSLTAPSGITLSTAPATANFSFDGQGRSSLGSVLTVTVTGDGTKTFAVEPETGYVHP